jgi:hypothetical protein
MKVLKKYNQIFEKKPSLLGYNSDGANIKFDEKGNPIDDSVEKEPLIEEEPYISDDDMYGRPYHGTFGEHNSVDFRDSVDEEDEISDDMQHLLYLLRAYFKNSGIEADLSCKDLDISVSIVLNKRDKLSFLMKSFDCVKKMHRDILPQYDSEFELWSTKLKEPMLLFNFLYDGDEIGDETDETAPF